MFSDILQAVDNGDLAALVLLDMSAAFDTVDHIYHFVTAFAPHLRHRRYSSRVVSVVSLIQEAVRTPRPSKSSVAYLVCGVPQGSVLGPILFILYTVDLLMVIESYGLSPHNLCTPTTHRCTVRVVRLL